MTGDAGIAPGTASVDARGRWYYGWTLVALCALPQIAAMALPISSFSLFLPVWSGQFHTPNSTLQLSLAFDSATCALLAPLIGGLADSRPTRILLSAGCAGLALFCLGMSRATSLWHFMVLYGLVLPVSVLLSTSIPANVLISRWFVRRRGLALGLTSLGLSAAGVIAPPVVAWLIPWVGWRAVWMLAGTGVAAVIFPLVLLLIRERPTPRDGLHYVGTQGTTAIVGIEAAGGPHDELGWREILSHRAFWLLVVAYLPMLGLYTGCGSNLASIASSRGLSPHTASLIMSGFCLSQLTATFAVGALSDRFGGLRLLASLSGLTATGGIVIALGSGLNTLAIGVDVIR